MGEKKRNEGRKGEQLRCASAVKIFRGKVRTIEEERGQSEGRNWVQ